MCQVTGDIPAGVERGLGSPAGHRLDAALVVAGVVYALHLVRGPAESMLTAAVRARLSALMQRRLVRAVSAPAGIGHLEDPEVLDRLARARGELSNDQPAGAPMTVLSMIADQLILREAVGMGDLPRMHDGAALDAALLRAGAATMAAGFPDGPETLLGRYFTGGRELSGGQWQRIGLARGMMRAAPLLTVLDEPTASLDAPTEAALFERFARAAERSSASGAVTVLVSHRFSTVRMADLIVVVEDGRVSETGSHAELMTAGGTYAQLFELQAKAYRPGR